MSVTVNVSGLKQKLPLKLGNIGVGEFFILRKKDTFGFNQVYLKIGDSDKVLNCMWVHDSRWETKFGMLCNISNDSMVDLINATINLESFENKV